MKNSTKKATTKSKTKSVNSYIRVAKGVYETPTGYRARKMVHGKRYEATFSNKAKAIKYYKSFNVN